MFRSIVMSAGKSRAARAAAAVTAALVAWAVVIGGVFGLERASLLRDANKLTSAAGSPGRLTRRFEMPGLRLPPAVQAGASGLADDEEVIGLVVAGRPRAYRLKALEYPPWHVVNDVVGDVPITIAYCNLSGCTRAYSGIAGSGPLDVSQAGLIDGEMILKLGRTAIVHRTGQPLDPTSGSSARPIPEHQWTRTTWREWTSRHPTTDVFVGLPARRPD